MVGAMNRGRRWWEWDRGKDTAEVLRTIAYHLNAECRCDGRGCLLCDDAEKLKRITDELMLSGKGMK